MRAGDAHDRAAARVGRALRRVAARLPAGVPGAARGAGRLTAPGIGRSPSGRLPGAPPRAVACHDAMGYDVGSSMTVAIPDEELQALRRHGFGVAYRMLGSVSEAEDVAQEALLGLTPPADPIAEPAAWMTTVATRLSINVLKSARARRESYVGPWLPEPLVEDPAPGPASRAEVADSLSLALLVLLERLTPVERAAYLLREVFGYEYAEVARIIERTEVNTRQLVTRARKHLEASRPRFDPDEAARDALLERFLAAAEEGDLEALEELLAKDAVLYADGGGKAMAPQQPLFGGVLIARFMARITRLQPALGALEARMVRV